jgi:protein TonB
MFEQSVVEARTLTARPWTLAVSVMGQAVLITAAVVLPMLHPETLKRVVMLVPIGGPPPAYHPPAAQPAQSARPVAVSPRAFRCTFCAPRSIPPTIDTVPDEPGGVVGLIGDPGIQGVVGGTGWPGGSGVGRVPEIPPPPRVKPVQAVQSVVRQTPPPAPAAPTRVGGDVQASLLIFKPEPPYPPLARQARIQGAVHLTALISTEGRITSLRATDGHPLLVRAAIDAVKQWVYRPTLLNGVPVEVVTEITVTFSLN